MNLLMNLLLIYLLIHVIGIVPSYFMLRYILKAFKDKQLHPNWTMRDRINAIFFSVVFSVLMLVVIFCLYIAGLIIFGVVWVIVCIHDLIDWDKSVKW